ncbi:MAG: hypothetical protein M3137_12765 [Actinomycetota bacterium]|nr:hypothetical protein [Actinomycetota bacterium]
MATGRKDSGGIDAGAGDPGADGGGPGSGGHTPGGGGGGGGVPTCTADDGTVGPISYEPVPPDLLDDEQKAQAANGGGWYYIFCGGAVQGHGPGSNGIVAHFFPAGSPGGPPVDPAALAQQALQHTPLPTPQIGMAPDPSIPQLVNLATFLWIPAGQWQPQTASASAGGVTSTVTATPESVTWNMGQGGSVTCDGPGAPYDPSLPDAAQPSDCKFTYPASSARAPGQTFTVTATVKWHATWTASGAVGGGDLGISQRSSSTAVRVAELQALNSSSHP